MTNTYAINCTRGQEFHIESELNDLGLAPWVPRLLANRYVKEKRTLVWYDRPYVHKLIFCVVPAIYWPDVLGLKHVIGKPLQLSELDIHGDRARGTYGLADFRDLVEAEYADAERRKANTEYQCQFVPGQAVDLLLNTFTDMPAVFRDVVRRSHDEYAKLRCEVEMMGATIKVEVDPDKVRAAG